MEREGGKTDALGGCPPRPLPPTSRTPHPSSPLSPTQNPAATAASSFASLPKAFTPGVAAGGGGDPIRGDVGLGAPLAPGDPLWAVFGPGGAPPELGDVAVSEVAEFDPTYGPDGDPVDEEEREREEEEARAAGAGADAEEREREREREEEEKEEAERAAAGGRPKSEKERERERERDRARARPPGFESFATKAPPAGAAPGATVLDDVSAMVPSFVAQQVATAYGIYGPALDVGGFMAALGYAEFAGPTPRGAVRAVFEDALHATRPGASPLWSAWDAQLAAAAHARLAEWRDSSAPLTPRSATAAQTAS